jgi:AraC-like DNA-binding protein
MVHLQPGIRSAALAARLFLSVRQLQRRFRYVVGCPLKSYQRLRRANRALALLQARGDRPLGEIAYELDYADQSHFIRDIKAFTWMVPGRLGRVWEVQSRDGVGFSFAEGP